MPDCPEVANGRVEDELDPSGAPVQERDRAHSLGHTATLRCDRGYVSNTKPKFLEVADVKCVADDARGSFWAHEDSGERAVCLRGCTEDGECRMDEFCRQEDNRCVRIPCDLPKGHHYFGEFNFKASSFNLKVGDSGNLTCSRGYVYK